MVNAPALPEPWLTVNVWPAIVKVPLRAPVASAPTLKETIPLPLPDAPEVIVIQSTLLVAAQPQPDWGGHIHGSLAACSWNWIGSG